MQSIASENNLSETAYLRPAGAAGNTTSAGSPRRRRSTSADTRPWPRPGWCSTSSAIRARRWCFIRRAVRCVCNARATGSRWIFRAGDRARGSTRRHRGSAGGVKILEAHRYRDLLLLLEDEAAVRDCAPEFGALKKICDKLIITAKGSGETDFVSRFFAPGLGIDEDPVTGSAHSQLIPFWSRRLDKRQLNARQLSGRGGHLVCEQLNDERVLMKGQAVFFTSKAPCTCPDPLLLRVGAGGGSRARRTGAGLVARGHRVRQPHLDGLDVPSPAGAHRRFARRARDRQRRAAPRRALHRRQFPALGTGAIGPRERIPGPRALATRHAGPQPRSQRRELLFLPRLLLLRRGVRHHP